MIQYRTGNAGSRGAGERVTSGMGVGVTGVSPGQAISQPVKQNMEKEGAVA